MNMRIILNVKQMVNVDGEQEKQHGLNQTHHHQIVHHVLQDMDVYQAQAMKGLLGHNKLGNLSLILEFYVRRMMMMKLVWLLMVEMFI
eukprot:CAMPEP_0201568006 /NCGR_PEP_ID=MMETSP0190_2-20130828/8825_1 /ASSEMBLY_ACC=CAM_ASM_000263 /TAXON_ID=37353 /ORGANISM="Rosalina sp." /LENGTH=87 /DNA_ID=CAMNT_0047988649 /DNA_START=324 /DNA_END=587 /DNA_ORIENTATION=-